MFYSYRNSNALQVTVLYNRRIQERRKQQLNVIGFAYGFPIFDTDSIDLLSKMMLGDWSKKVRNKLNIQESCELFHQSKSQNIESLLNNVIISKNERLYVIAQKKSVYHKSKQVCLKFNDFVQKNKLIKVLQGNDQFVLLNKGQYSQLNYQIHQLISKVNKLNKKQEATQTRYSIHFIQVIYFSIFYFQYIIFRNSNLNQAIPQSRYPKRKQFGDRQSSNCLAIALNKKQTIMVAGFGSLIAVFDFQQGQLSQKQVLNNHSWGEIYSLYFMKESNQFLSGAESETGIWSYNDLTRQYYYQQMLNATGDVNRVIMNKKEDQIIYCSYRTIKFWIRMNEWQCSQELTDHKMEVYDICLNESCSQLVSCDEDKLILIYEQGNDQTWRKVQRIIVENY